MAKKEKVVTIGSVVQLKSGGPQMVVVSAQSNANVILTVLVWSEKHGTISKYDIALQAVKLVK